MLLYVYIDSFSILVDLPQQQMTKFPGGFFNSSYLAFTSDFGTYSLCELSDHPFLINRNPNHLIHDYSSHQVPTAVKRQYWIH
jgi:hypothetical protein